MGVVYRGMHPGLDLPVAIKVLAETFSKDPNFRQRFQREAATIASLNHPGIVRVYDFDTDPAGSLFIVMEYVEGRSLRHVLGQYGRFTLDVSLDLIHQMLSAVGAAHDRGIVHRDLKPENVLISKEGKTKILDFGVSKLLDSKEHLTATGSMVGTPAYMSPEQVKGEDVDKRADIYALGNMLYELLHGEPPFTGTIASVLHAQVFDPPRPSTAIPQPIMQVIWKATAKNRDERFSTCEEFAGALQYLPQGATPPPHAPPPTTPSEWHKKLPHINLPRIGGNKHGGCSHTGCNGREGWACSYKDLSHRGCGTWWCRDHIQFIESIPFCPRHASVVRVLLVTAGTIREIKHLPAVDDRALPLAALVSEDANKDITELLRRRYSGRKDVNIAVDKTVRQTWVGRLDVAWERSWAAMQSTGYLTRIGIRVAYKEPDRVEVTIGNTVVFSEVPDWIARRRDGEPPDHGDRARFRKKIVDLVQSQVDRPVAVQRGAAVGGLSSDPAIAAFHVNQALLEGMILRLLTTTTQLTAYEMGDRLAVPFGNVEQALKTLSAANFIEAHGFASDAGPWQERPLPERMRYSITNQGRARGEEIAAAGTRYMGPAPVSLDEYQAALAEATRPGSIPPEEIREALLGLEVAANVIEAITAAVNSRGSLFIYGAPGNGKTSLARRLTGLMGGPILLPIALDLDGDVLTVFDPAVHRPEGQQPADRRWKRVARPLVQVGGEFTLEMLDPTWEEGSRTYQAPLGVKANGGVLLIDDLGRQKVAPKQILDRLLVPLEQEVDYMNLSGSGRKVEVPFKCQVALSTNMQPGDLLDEAYLRRLSYKVLMPDPTWEQWCRIFESERTRMQIPPEPRAFELIRGLYGGRPMRGNHARDLLERLTDVASARNIPPTLTPDLIQAAWQTLFVTSAPA
jgi:predicted Ser/Thr protein kinase